MPSDAKNVDLLRALVVQSSVNVGAVYSVIWGPFDLRLFRTLAIEVENPDLTQTIDVIADTASKLTGPWSSSLWNGLQGIGPATNRADIFEKPGQLFVRLVARSADGAGVNGVLFSVSGIEQRLISGSL